MINHPQPYWFPMMKYHVDFKIKDFLVSGGLGSNPYSAYYQQDDLEQVT